MNLLNKNTTKQSLYYVIFKYIFLLIYLRHTAEL